MRILVVYYSLYGHVLQLARAAEKGAASVPGVEVVFRRVKEFEDQEKDVQTGKHTKPVWELQKDVPACSLDDLRAADGIIWGTPTRYGNMIAQMKRLFDSTPKLWLEGAFEGKPAGVLVSTATTHGGQETTALTMYAPLIHLGMIIVGTPYSTPGLLHTEGRGGTPYGPTTVAGPANERKPTPEELSIAEALGKRVAEVANKLRG